jgi:hypothetical protein
MMKRKEMAPILLVETRKDIVTSPEDHEEISKVLSSTFLVGTFLSIIVTVWERQEIPPLLFAC